MAKTNRFVIILTVLLLAFTAFAEDPPGTASKDPAMAKEADKKDTAAKPDLPKGPLTDMEKLRLEIQKLEEKLNKMAEENDIRRRLETTAEEKSSNDESILSAAGREYTLMKPGNLGFEYNLSYMGDAYDSVTITTTKLDSGTTSSITNLQRNSYHTIINSFYIEYPVKENLTVSSNIPFIYKMDSMSDSSNVKDVSDFGDVSFGCQFQPIKSGGDYPSIILSANLTCPTGRSPYKIDTTTEMSTGGGTYSVSGGLNLSKSIDPIMAFGGINYSHPVAVHNLNQKVGGQGEAGQYLYQVTPGDTYAFNMGIGYSLSYKVNLTLAYQYAYQSKSIFYWVGKPDTSTSGSISSEFSVGTGWNITPKKSMNIKVGIGLTTNDPAFSIQLRIPFTYEL